MVTGRYADRRALLLAAAAAALLGGWCAGGHEAQGPAVGTALAAALASDGLDVAEASVVWVEAPPPEGASRRGWQEVLFQARERSGFADVYRADVRVVPRGIAGVRGLANLTRSRSADEGPPVPLGDYRVAFTIRVGGEVDAVSVLDLRGEPASLTRGWSALRRWQNAISNLQETGRVAGFGRTRLVLRPPAADARLASDPEGRLVIDLGGRRVVWDPERPGGLREGAGRVEVQAAQKGRPGGITWVVDTVRAVTGPTFVEWLEHRVFAVRDGLRWARYALDPGEGDGAEQAAADLGVQDEAERRRRVELSATDPKLGWPPPPLDPLFASPLEGEGVWLSTIDDPFVATYPNAPPAFAQTFLRPDLERGYVRIYLTAFDPRQIQLRVMTGTREPESATGETGPGRVPRDPETLDRLVGAFNGGFQALHGEFGMMSDGRIYLPPKPWAATVGVEETGRVVMGSWLPPPENARTYDEAWAREQIPPGLVEFRQNLTSVVEDGIYNPWERWWWGAAPRNAREQTYIDRSGLCLTEEGFLVYFWGDSLGPDALGEAMLRARCVRGLHLDMNSRHTGLEFYRTQPAEVGFEALGRPLDRDAEYEGPFPGVDGLLLRARRAVKSMTTMRFPRWVGRDPRDFFYLVQRPVLPGPALPRAGLGPDAAGRYDASGLPAAGWPPAFARAWLGAEDGARTWLVRIDPQRARFTAETPWDDDDDGDDENGTAEAGNGPFPTSPPPGQDVPDGGPAAEADAGPAAGGAAARPLVPEVLAFLTGAAPLADGDAVTASRGGDDLAAVEALWRLPPGEGPRRLRRTVGERWGLGAPPPGAEVVVSGPPVAFVPGAGAALGIDGEGFLVYAERGPEDATPMADRLRQAGVEAAIGLPDEVRLAFLLDGKTLGPDAYERPVTGAGDLRIVSRPEARATGVLFPQVEPKGYWTWARLQDARVRYFREGPPRFTVPTDAGPEADGAEDDLDDDEPGPRALDDGEAAGSRRRRSAANAPSAASP